VRVTIIDIARFAGVSKSTVSRVLNDDARVSETARRKVLGAVEKLDYQPNAAARSLVLKKSHSISLIIQDIRNPYYAYGSWYAERTFHARGYDMVIHNADNDRELEREILGSITRRGVDGVLSIGGNRNVTSIVDFYARNRLPLVLIDREVPGYDIPSINLNNRLGAKLATNHLFSLGHKSIAFVTSDFTVAEMRRQEGYHDAFRERNFQPEMKFVISQSEELWSEGKCPELSGLIEKGDTPTAIFASNDLKAVQAMRILREHGLRVPRDVSVVGYDDVYLLSVVSPTLTTVHQPLDMMVEAGATMLLDIVNGTHTDVGQQLFEPTLVQRESTGPVSTRSQIQLGKGATR